MKVLGSKEFVDLRYQDPAQVIYTEWRKSNKSKFVFVDSLMFRLFQADIKQWNFTLYYIYYELSDVLGPGSINLTLVKQLVQEVKESANKDEPNKRRTAEPWTIPVICVQCALLVIYSSVCLIILVER